jgi:hypothetical protein
VPWSPRLERGKMTFFLIGACLLAGHYLSLALAICIGSHPLNLQAELQSAAGDSLYFSILYLYVNQLHK